MTDGSKGRQATQPQQRRVFLGLSSSCFCKFQSPDEVALVYFADDEGSDKEVQSDQMVADAKVGPDVE